MSHFRNATVLAATFAALFFVLFVSSARAGDGCCKQCGGCDGCEKTCRLVCEEKKVEITCWGYKCEDFCLPAHSKRGCKHCEEVCEECECDPEAPCTAPKKFVWYDWIGACSDKVCTKRKLMKKVITKKVPTVKWVVEDLCCDCQAAAECQEIPADAKIPPPPAVQAKIIEPRSR